MDRMFDRFGRDLGALCEKRLFLLDLDGTLYEEERLFPDSLAFLRNVRRRGGDYVYISNNSSRSVSAYIEKLARLGIASEASDFLISTDAAIRYIQKQYPGQLVFAMGTRSFLAELRAAGIPVTEAVDPAVAVVLMAYDTELNYEKLTNICEILSTREPELPFIATNCDLVCPCRFGFVPDCGSVAEMIVHATGRRPRFLGKPEATMLELAREMKGVPREACCVIGDRLYTDIAAGQAAGMTSICVLSGEARLDDVAAMTVRPDYTVDDIAVIRRLLEAPITGKDSSAP